MNYYSQQEEDKILFEEIYKGKVPKFKIFIEVGAMNGIKYSNTKFFQDNFNWGGILIEPLKDQFQELVTNRIWCECYNYAISETEGEVEFIGNNATAGMVHTMTEGHKSCWHKNVKNTYKVKSIPINKLINRYKYPKIELFSVDVEGGEYEVLNTFDWDSIEVHYVLIEISEIGEDNSGYKVQPYFNLDKDQKCRDLLSEKGFQFIRRIGNNDLWENKKYIE